MIDSGEAESRAVASAIRGAVAQSRLDAGVNIAGLLVDLDVAVDADYRQLFMCWHLTRVLGPSLTEMVPPQIVRGLLGYGKGGTASPHRKGKSGASSAIISMQLHSEPWGGPHLTGSWPAMVNDRDGASPPTTSDDHVLCASGHRTCWCPEDAWAAPRDGAGDSATSA